jgi:peptidoglycan hydrolase-like protein with peptidoglycan-binding domain
MRRALLAVGLIVVGGAAASGLLLLGRPVAAGPAPSHAASTKLVPVVRTTLVASQPVSGQVASSQTWTVGLPTGSSPDDVAAAADAVAAAQDGLTRARSALVAARRTRTLILARDRAAITAAPAGTARQEATRMRNLDAIDQDGAVAMAEAAVADAQRVLAAARRDLAAKRQGETSGGTTVTRIATAGAAIAVGEAVYALDGRDVVLLLGTTPVYRALREGDAGPDVAQLQTNLVALGFGGTPQIHTDGTFDHATTLAVKRWQAARHVETGGVVRLGDVVVLPAAVRVTAAHAAIGAAVQPGSPMIDLASVDEVVKIDLDPGLAPSVHVGDPIRFSAPDGADIPGSIVSVGAPTVSDQGSGNGPPGQLVITAVAAPEDPAALAALDGAVLQSDVTTGTSPDTLAVPVAALVVLADGSFGVEVSAAGTTHFVRVEPGIYDRTMVEIHADGIAEGDQVVVPGA